MEGAKNIRAETHVDCNRSDDTGGRGVTRGEGGDQTDSNRHDGHRHNLWHQLQ